MCSSDLYYTPIRTLGYIAVSGTMLLALSLLSPHCYNNTYANDVTSRTIITPSVSIAMTEPGSIDITPSGGGQFGAVSSKLQVATTNNAGYSIYLNTLDQTNAMVNVNGNNKLSIQAIDSEQRPSDFKANTWGFALTRDGSNTGESPALTNLLYQPAPTTSSLVTSIPRATETDTYTLAFGANIDTSLPTGQYANTVLVSVVANPQTIRTLSDLTYMQEMSTLSCENSSLHETKQLIDLRDNKDYWVAKLADGNCWMTQNLALDLNEKTLPLKPESSDVSREWGPTHYTETIIPNSDDSGNLRASRSWNLGKYVINRPDIVQGCTPVTSGTTLEKCVQEGIMTNVAGDGWQDRDLGSGISVNGSSYNAHYLIGNHYQWNAATAGSAIEAVSSGAEQDESKLVDAHSSICPKGWQLPTSGRNTVAGFPFDREKSFYRLLRAYEYPNFNDYNLSGSVGKTPILNNILANSAHQNPALSPMYFVRGGYVGPDSTTNYFRYLVGGEYNYDWSSTVTASNSSAFDFVITSADYIVPAYGEGRSDGFSIRCLAR